MEAIAGNGRDEGPTFDVYRRHDGSWVVHVDTLDMDENGMWPLITVYINDDIENPVFDNRQ